ncbi:Patatin-like phospholipase [Caloramator mitchellensis]|uniref:Patatin-like phospholipase n=1 Tax=Caloramator mitchellensis TaxID=908809 RepID=A0A0R3JUZ6_CALMK|nr:patatin-like phospholipase family protein [Caloramator mitchellensis]KRQ87398.1 Patatin-like phospholipase [Caloramator mitchellensis]
MFFDAVFEGGGVKGIGIVGALCYLEDIGYKVKKVAGTSAGAIIAALLAAGYSAYEIKRILMNFDFRRILDKDSIQSIPIVGSAAGIIFEKGVYSGDYFEDWISVLLEVKGVRKFKDVYKDGEFLLKIIATDITKKEILVLPDDLKKYGIDPMEFDIAKAVRMSISIPFFFKPVKLEYNHKFSYIVDGGVLSNFPVWIFDVEGVPRWPTFGFKLVEPNLTEEKNDGSNIIRYTLDIIATMIEENDLRYIKNKDFVRTITIPSMDVKTIDFDLSASKKLKLFNSGYTSAKKFIESWDFQKYIEKYRMNDAPDRRETLLR